jgi:hypothetical protein
MKLNWAAAAAAIFTAFVLFSLAGFQVTGEVAGPRLLSRVAAALIEIDPWLEAHREDIELSAREQPQADVPLADLPIEVVLTPAEIDAAQASAGGLRSLISERMGRQLYEQGTAAFRDREGAPLLLSTTEPVRWTVTLLEEDMRSFWQMALIAGVLLLAIVLAANWLAGGPMPLPYLAAGAIFAAVASLGVLLLAQAGRAMLDSAVDREIMLVLRDGAWIGLRNGLAVSIATGCLTLLLRRPGRRTANSPWHITRPTPPDTPSA